MRKSPEIEDIIFEKWQKGQTFKELSELEFDSLLSLKTIRNIICSCNSEHAQEIYSLFKIKFLELQDVNEATKFVYKNQPKFTVSERTIRRIINNKLNNKKKI